MDVIPNIEARVGYNIWAVNNLQKLIREW
jgi:hypothetical protein